MDTLRVSSPGFPAARSETPPTRVDKDTVASSDGNAPQPSEVATRPRMRRQHYELSIKGQAPVALIAAAAIPDTSVAVTSEAGVQLPRSSPPVAVNSTVSVHA